MENTKLTSEEINQLKFLNNNHNSLLLELGDVEYKLISLNNIKNNILDRLKEFKNTENNLAKNLQEKYGEGVIDLNKEEFIPNK